MGRAVAALMGRVCRLRRPSYGAALRALWGVRCARSWQQWLSFAIRAAQRPAPLSYRMPLLATDAIVLHSFDYLESSRIFRLVTRDGGVRSVLAKGARRSSRRFGSALDLFAQGSAQLYAKPGRDLD